MPYEIYELTRTVTPFKIAALALNLLIALYLLFAKRLFGLRGGAAAEAERGRATSAGMRSSGPRLRHPDSSDSRPRRKSRSTSLGASSSARS